MGDHHSPTYNDQFDKALIAAYNGDMPMYLEKKNYVDRLLLTETEKAYIAGLFDGEGCVSMHFRDPLAASREVSSQLVVQVTLSMTHKPTIEWLCAITGTEHFAYDRESKGWKDIYLWRPPMPVAYDVLSQIHPYSITKKRNIELFLEVMDVRATSTRANNTLAKQSALAEENIKINERRGPNSNV